MSIRPLGWVNKDIPEEIGHIMMNSGPAYWSFLRINIRKTIGLIPVSVSDGTAIWDMSV